MRHGALNRALAPTFSPLVSEKLHDSSNKIIFLLSNYELFHIVDSAAIKLKRSCVMRCNRRVCGNHVAGNDFRTWFAKDGIIVRYMEKFGAFVGK